MSATSRAVFLSYASEDAPAARIGASGQPLHRWKGTLKTTFVEGACLGLVRAVVHGNETRSKLIAYTSFECVTGPHGLSA